MKIHDLWLGHENLNNLYTLTPDQKVVDTNGEEVWFLTPPIRFDAVMPYGVCMWAMVFGEKIAALNTIAGKTFYKGSALHGTCSRNIIFIDEHSLPVATTFDDMCHGSCPIRVLIRCDKTYVIEQCMIFTHRYSIVTPTHTLPPNSQHIQIFNPWTIFHCFVYFTHKTLPSDLIDLVFRKTVKKWQFMIKWLP
jgi:hypothetical protein